MKRIKKILGALALTAMIALPTAASYAETIGFTDFSFTGFTGTEVWYSVKSATKADNEQSWYLTLTASAGLSSTDVRAIAMSYYTYTGPYRLNRGYVALKSTSGAFGATPYNMSVEKDDKYALWVSGNENNRVDYYMTISGRFTP